MSSYFRVFPAVTRTYRRENWFSVSPFCSSRIEFLMSCSRYVFFSERAEHARENKYKRESFYKINICIKPFFSKRTQDTHNICDTLFRKRRFHIFFPLFLFLLDRPQLFKRSIFLANNFVHKKHNIHTFDKS